MILVTGATGFTGNALCARLIDSGAQVVAFVRASSNCDTLKEMGVECRIVDLCSSESVSEAFHDINMVYHIAAAYRTEHASTDTFTEVNVGGTKNLLEAAQKAGVERFVHCSTVGVQGEIDDPPADEEYRFKPGDHYQESKLEGELLARRFFKDNDLPGCVFRPVGIYGPGDTRFLKLFRSVAKRVFVMIGNGSVLYHMTFIDDLVDGIILCGTHPDAIGEVFTLGGEKYTTLRELVDEVATVLNVKRSRIRIPYAPVFLASIVCDKLCKLIKVSPPIYPRRVEFFSKDRAFSIDKAKHILGYQPKVGLTEGLSRTARWYQEQKLI